MYCVYVPYVLHTMYIYPSCFMYTACVTTMYILCVYLLDIVCALVIHNPLYIIILHSACTRILCAYLLITHSIYMCYRYGDKELFWVSATIAGLPYAFSPYMAGGLSNDNVG